MTDTVSERGAPWSRYHVVVITRDAGAPDPPPYNAKAYPRGVFLAVYVGGRAAYYYASGNKWRSLPTRYDAPDVTLAPRLVRRPETASA